MGLVRRVNVDAIAAGEGGSVDMSSIIRQAVAAEIERQRQEKLRIDAEGDVDRPGDED